MVPWWAWAAVIGFTLLLLALDLLVLEVRRTRSACARPAG